MITFNIPNNIDWVQVAIIFAILAAIIPLIYWIALYLKVGDIKNKQQEILEEQKKTNKILEKILDQNSR